MHYAHPNLVKLRRSGSSARGGGLLDQFCYTSEYTLKIGLAIMMIMVTYVHTVMHFLQMLPAPILPAMDHSFRGLHRKW